MISKTFLLDETYIVGGMNAECQPISAIEIYYENNGGSDLNYKWLAANNWTSGAVALVWNIGDAEQFNL
jgi:hypothetical protein